VAEKTGYPVDMLEMDMQLDDDLGIDSIKRVEIFSALQERFPEAPAVKPEHLGSLRTLRQIAEFLAFESTAQRAPMSRSGIKVPVSAGRNGDTHTQAVASLAPGPATPSVDVIRQVVAEKTGYPVDMLELDMQLDDDLGIDSIKRVEIFSALQERLPEAPAVKPEHLGSLRTLRHIVEFLKHEASSQASPLPYTSTAVPVSTAVSTPTPRGAEVLRQVVAEKTGYPLDMLELDMQLDDDLGIDSIKRVEIFSTLQERLPEAAAVKAEHLGSLRTLRQIAEFLDHQPSASGTVAGTLACLVPRVSPRALDESKEQSSITPGSEIWVVDDGSPLATGIRERLLGRGHEVRLIGPEQTTLPEAVQQVAGLIILASTRSEQRDLLRFALRLLRAAGPSLRWHGARGGSALLMVSRLDGAFGLGGLTEEIDPTSGALSGLLKTARQEWPEVHCKAVDLDAAYQIHGCAAERILDELLRRGPAEVGLTESMTSSVELVALPAGDQDRQGSHPLYPGEVVVISGGARGITAEVALGVARSCRPRLILLGRTPKPEVEPAWLAPLATDAAIRIALRDRAERSCSPREISEKLRLVNSQREISRNLERIAAAGAEVTYHAIDVRNRDAVHELLADVRTRSGPIRGLIHGAGVLADRKIEDLTDTQFDSVFDTKVGGLLSLVDAIDPTELRFLTLFSSSTARYGRVGQAAYAAANECLNKWAQKLSRRFSHCRVVAINWGPWDGGMVTASLKRMFQREGLRLIVPADGVRLLLDEIQKGGGRPAELVVLANHADCASLVDPAFSRPAESEVGASSHAHRFDGPTEPVFERRIDLSSLPVLRSHVIDGHAVLPLALMLEWLAEGALNRHPGMVAEAIENLRLLKGVVLADHRPATVSVRVGKGKRRGDSLLVPVEMHGVLKSGREVAHARADVVVSERHGPGEHLVVAGDLPPLATDQQEIYRRVLFHGPAMQAIQRVEGCDERTIAAWVSTAPPPASWIERPLRKSWLTDPLAIDAAFQLLVLWTRHWLSASSLPTAVGAYRQFRRSFPNEGVRVLAAVRQHVGHRAVADIDFLDSDANPVARIESYECVIDASLNQAFRRNCLPQFETASS
jgi:NAD(P)-dependent dehydrogenase (short-subunit alcohol dehydrogenase family)/acyl carrier protein